MNPARYFPLLLVLATTLAHAQLPDSVHVVVAGVEHPAYGAAFGPRFPAIMSLGPLPIVLVEGNGETTPSPSLGCDPLVNREEIEGNIAFVSRGVCAFVQKVRNAQEAGAVAVVIHDDHFNPGSCSLVHMQGDCSDCTIPAVFISGWCSGREIIMELASGPTDATLVPIRIASPVAAEEATQAGAFVLHPAYPNPLASRATISLDLPTAQAVRVAVFDVLGREVAVVHDGPLAVGPHTLTLDASALSAGLYLVRAMGAGHRATRKLVITR